MAADQLDIWDFSFYEQSENISVRFSNCPRCEISIEGLKFVQGRKKADKRKSLSRGMSYVTYRFHFVIVGREGFTSV